jgi:hypothetical protein
MNDSCERKITPDGLRANQVIALESPKGFLHNALVITEWGGGENQTSAKSRRMN